MSEARTLLESLGLPCLKADGEGEALCAQLTQLQVVDGCLTDDGDALLYGARKVYKNFSKKESNKKVECYSIEDIKDKLELDREDMITIALLAGCDYNEGVKDVGFKKAVELIKHLKTKQHNPLQRILKWRDCPELDQIEQDRLKNVKESHCSDCEHLGTKNVHKSIGCGMCVTDNGCKKASDTENSDHLDNRHHPCPCDWHLTDRQVRDHHVELKIREKALKVKEFPDMETVNEFSRSTDTQASVPELTWRKPSLDRFVKNCATLLSWNEATCIDKFLPTLVWSDLKARADEGYFSVTEGEYLKPCEILKSCQKKFTQCYEVSWERLKSDTWSSADKENYTVLVDQKMFESVFNEMVHEFEDAKEKEKVEKTTKKTKQKDQKRKSNDSVASGRQTQLTNYYNKVKKRRRTVSSEHVKSSSSSSES